MKSVKLSLIRWVKLFGKKFRVTFVLVYCLACPLLWITFSSAFADVDYSDFSQWRNIKGEHFIVYFLSKDHVEVSSQVLRKAEEYYDKIAYQIGYSRYSDFWTWEDRVKIFIFPDQQSFLATTGQQAWSKGYAVRDSKLFESRAIVTFFQENNFTDKLLPHEVSHLIVKDFIGFDSFLPIWFEEGIAQQLEVLDADQERAMIFLVKNGESIPFDMFHSWDIRRETDELRVGIFYAQSRSVVEFLLKAYGQASFQRLCINLRDHMNFEEALSHAYPASIESIQNLGEKWQAYMREK